MIDFAVLILVVVEYGLEEEKILYLSLDEES